MSGIPYLVGLHYKGGLYGISLSLFLLMCFFGALVLGLMMGTGLRVWRIWGRSVTGDLPDVVSLLGQSPAVLAIWEFPKIGGTLFWCPYHKDPAISGAKLGSPIFGNYHIRVWFNSHIGLFLEAF